MKGVMDYMALPYTRVVQERHDESWSTIFMENFRVRRMSKYW